MSVKVKGTDLVTEPQTAAESQSVSTEMTRPMAESQSATEPQAVMVEAEPQPARLCARPQVESQSVDVYDVSEPQSAVTVDVTSETRPDGGIATEPQSVESDLKIDFDGLSKWLESKPRLVPKSALADSDDDDDEVTTQSETQTAETVTETQTADVSETQTAGSESEMQSARDEHDAETMPADAVTLVRFDGSVVPWGERDDDDDDLWRMGGLPPPDDESQSGDDLTDRPGDMATGRRDDATMMADTWHVASVFLGALRRGSARRASRRRASCGSTPGHGESGRAADRVDIVAKARQHVYIKSKHGDVWRVQL